MMLAKELKIFYKMKKAFKSSLLVLLLCFVIKAKSNVILPNILSSNMVLQHDNPTFWGTADAGEKIKITIGEKSVLAKAEKNGKWSIKFSPLKIGEKISVIIEGKNRIELTNVLVGDVWLGSGQSNMVWELKHMENAKQEMDAANNFKEIRLFKVKNIGASYNLKEDVEGSWMECNALNVENFSATLYFFGINLYEKLQHPLGLVVDAWSGSRIQSWISLNDLRTDEQTKKEADEKLATIDDPVQLKKFNEEQYIKWQQDSSKASEKKIQIPGKPAPVTPLYKDRPGGLYNSMIAPLFQLGIKGIVWYQGEFNASDPVQYSRLLPMLITTWRKQWNNTHLPFIVIQLPNVNQPLAQPAESPWARLREAQLKALDLNNTALVVTLDTGDGELHPKTKRKLGARAAASALKLAYGMNVVADAPLYTGFKAEENRIRIFFKNVGSGFVSSDGKQLLKGFTIAGHNHKFVNANAVIDGSSIIVWNNKISIPVAVRYAWAQYPIINLYTKDSLPAFPFRTDNWTVDMKGIEDDTIRASVIKKLLSPDFTANSLKDWEKEYQVFQYKIAEKEEQVLPYRFYEPKIEQGKKYPLVLMMHGAGERGFDNRTQLMRLYGLPFWEQNPCFVIAPQCPQKPLGNLDEESVWVQTSFGAPSHTMKPDPTWPLQMVMDLLNKAMQTYPIDTSRIYITGLSMGGFATWELLQRMPYRFAAAVPVCGGGDTTFVKSLAPIPLWVFHGDADKTVIPQRSRDMIEGIKKNGGHPIYTEYKGIGHGAWTQTYNNPDLWKWMFSQIKTNK